MKRFMLSIVVLPLALVFSAGSAFGQAAAESALLNANSATTAAKAGSALGSALSRVNKQLAGQVLEVSHPALGETSHAKQPTRAPQDSAGRLGTTPASGALITSIDGAASTSCVPTNPPPARPEKTAVVSAQTNCNHSASKPALQKYKAEITVSFQN
jgi:hypothetical protein